MPQTDIELVALAKVAASEAAFAQLVNRHQAPLRAFLRRLCGSDFLADDIAQETFIKAHGALKDFHGGGSFRSWLYAIAYREFLQNCRKESAAAKLGDALKSEAQNATHADSSIEMNLSLDLRQALASLDELERAALLLCDAAGLSHSEASIAIDRPLGSIKTLIARARQKMREKMDGSSPPPEPTSETIENGVCHAH